MTSEGQSQALVLPTSRCTKLWDRGVQATALGPIRRGQRDVQEQAARLWAAGFRQRYRWLSSVEKVVFATESAGIIGYPQAKMRTFIHTFHNVQKSTQINHRLKDKTYKYKTVGGRKQEIFL